MKSYRGLIQLESYDERLKYLQLFDNNYGSPRKYSQTFFKSGKWLSVRRQIINRDMVFDLGVFGIYIHSKVIVHHINPITIEDIEKMNIDKLFNPDNLITTSVSTHNKIHYAKYNYDAFEERRSGDTILW